MRGTVVRFDEHEGLGAIQSDDADGPDGADADPLAFHCTAIADGSRTIAVGTPVTFGLVAGLGRYEAADIRPA